eukprot:TRINITY_DN11058_c0_g1_i1.p1 TRINITY_DN11058_c0_g1~~TRINITY_DN11058_c0_g1_i1.p1  ORF type:complete len:1145 (+),score=213.73 TRINITY_DN11058_c0_g1_i1:87-3437(+)
MSDAASAMPRTKVFFRWNCNNVGPNEEVRVVGSCEELGHWCPARGLQLLRAEQEDEGACWTSNGVFLPLRKAVEYKYIICSTIREDDVRWEPRELNRQVVPTGRRHILEDDDGVFRHIPVGAQIRGDCVSEPCTGKVVGGNRGKQSTPRLQRFDEWMKREDEWEVTSQDPILAVFRSLPVKVARDESGWKVVEEGTMPFKVVTLLKKCLTDGSEEAKRMSKMKFVGDPGVRVTDPEERRKIVEVLAPHGCIPVFIDEQVCQRNLEFCHSFLWPVMHGMKVFDDVSCFTADGDGRSMDIAKWKNYQLFNRAYAEVVEANFTQGTLVWVHDFYLLLVPRYLKLRCPRCTIGLFMHSAFPGSEVMRCIASREEILASMLACHMVGFQIFDYARHFLTCCQVMMNALHAFHGEGVLQVEHQGEMTVVRTDHFVLPYQIVATLLQQPRVTERAKEWRDKFAGRRIFASIDGDEPFSGLILKFRSFLKLLTECPQHTHNVALIQHVLTRRLKSAEESELLRELRHMAEEMNNTFGKGGKPLVVVTVGEMHMDDRVALLKSADILLDTSINDGLNLHPFIYHCAHSEDRDGAIIVSEFSGCSSVLTGARLVNPWNTQSVMDAMHAVLTMDKTERMRTLARDHKYISTQRLSQWAYQNLLDLKQAAGEKTQTSPVKGLGAGAQLFFMERGFRHLNFDCVLADYRQAKNRAIFLDTEGTLSPDRRGIMRPYSVDQDLGMEGQPVDPIVVESLRQLVNDRDNTVVVLSGRERHVVESWFGDIPGLGLCAEHGFYWVPPEKPNQRGISQGMTTSKDRWHCMLEASSEEDNDWKAIAFRLFQQYVKRVQGSVVEYKGSAITWNYRKVSAPQLAHEAARELTRFLDPTRSGTEALMHGYPVVVVNGKCYVEVKRRDVDKGVAVRRVLQTMPNSKHIDFVLCMGDDRSDEDMFEVIQSLRSFKQVVEEDEPLSPTLSDRKAYSNTGQADRHGNIAPGGETECSGSRTSLVTLGNTSEGNTPGPSPSKKTSRKRVHMTLEDVNPKDNVNRSKYYSVTVGRKPSKASNFVKDTDEVSQLLQKLALEASVKKMSRFASMPMLAQSEDQPEVPWCRKVSEVHEVGHDVAARLAT